MDTHDEALRLACLSQAVEFLKRPSAYPKTRDADEVMALGDRFVAWVQRSDEPFTPAMARHPTPEPEPKPKPKTEQKYVRFTTENFGTWGFRPAAAKQPESKPESKPEPEPELPLEPERSKSPPGRKRYKPNTGKRGTPRWIKGQEHARLAGKLRWVKHRGRP